MELHGQNLIAGATSAQSSETFRGMNPATGQALEPVYYAAADAEIDRAAVAAGQAAREAHRPAPEKTARLLELIADGIDALGDELLDRTAAETGLTRDRLVSERARTVNQCRMFARVVREGSWLQARIDTGIPDRKPLPKPDLRQMLIPLGPIAVFGASNFPFAYSVAGGDTASAFAAGNPVVVKAHPAHPGTSELVGQVIVAAVHEAGFPAGWFSMVHGPKPETGLALVRHPQIQGVGFTGSLRGGRALFDAANARPQPIPVHAEMGSTNPIFILPGALKERGEQIAQGLKTSVTTGAGQFCTKPGIIVGMKDDVTDEFVTRSAELITQSAPTTMLHTGIRSAYESGVERLGKAGAALVQRERINADPQKTEGATAVFTAPADRFLSDPLLAEEVFGPATLMVRCTSMQQMEQVARNLQGQLTATIHATPQDLEDARTLLAILEEKAGRIIFNGYPTGVEVCDSIHHGGPYPATTDVRSTSVGSLALRRWAKPCCYQSMPPELLPDELKDENPRQIWRLVNGEFKK